MVHPSSGNNGVTVKPVSVKHAGKSSDDEVALHLENLLKDNYDHYSILYNNFRFHNHTAHFLGCVYLLGGSNSKLDAVYDDVVKRDNLELWEPSPGAIDLNNYRSYLSRGAYQRSWADFFQKQIQAVGDWQSVATRFLLETGPENHSNSAPVFLCLTAGLGHPLIHLGYAFELDSREVALEALSLAATCYDPQLISLLTRPSVSNPRSEPTTDLFELFLRVREDKRLPIFPHPGDQNFIGILNNPSQLDIVFSHFDSWSPDDLTSQFAQAYRLASAVLISTSPQLGGHGYDFFLVHLLTTAQALRVLLPHLHSENHSTLIREWLLMSLLAYVAQNRPALDPAHVESFDLQDRGWEYVRRQALDSTHASDAHFAKACRAMMVGAETWPDNDAWFLSCAVRFASEFERWAGFTTEGKDAEHARQHRIRDGIHV